MRCLVGCERSGVVRSAFRALGHDAWSVDLVPAEDKSRNHIIADVLTVLDRDWDAGIFFPDCTYITCSAEWAYGDGPYHQRVKPGTLVGAKRRKARLDAKLFVHALWNSGIPRIAIENPVGVLHTVLGPAAQTIQPYEFGHDASKRTCLWLKGLPLLVPTLRIKGRMVEWPKGSGKMVERWANQTDSGQNKLTPGAGRAMERSRTYAGIGSAMANQWR